MNTNPIPTPQKVLPTKSEIVLLTITKKERKKYTTKNGKKRINSSVNISTLENERKLIDKLSKIYFSCDDNDATRKLLELTKLVYNFNCTKIATHAWKKSNTRLCFIVSCFFYSINKSNFSRIFSIEKVIKEKKLQLRTIIEFYIIIDKCYK